MLLLQAGSLEFDQACIARIQPFWETLSAHSRMDLLSIPVAAAKQGAERIALRHGEEGRYAQRPASLKVPPCDCSGPSIGYRCGREAPARTQVWEGLDLVIGRHGVPERTCFWGIWQRYRRSCMLAEPVEIVQLILDALKGEEACLACPILALVIAFVSEDLGGELPATTKDDP
eukprot:jgi/Astpho2/6800/Aster-07244